jgi:protein-glutamine gamma-glutamyltransferase
LSVIPDERASAMRVGAFAGLSALAAWRYAAIAARTPTARVAAVTASAVVAAVALSMVRAGESRRARATAARLIVVGALFVVALLAAGVPIGLLRPARWGALAAQLHGGFRAISTTLWPYKGGDAWTRIDILLGLVVASIAAAALGFWPAARGPRLAMARYRMRQVAALALLLAVYVIGVIDSAAPSIAVDGLLLLASMVAWLWLPGLRVGRATAALCWLAVAGGLAAVVAGQIAAKQAWLDYRAWGLFGARVQGISFTWDQSYGPITWSRSGQTVFTVAAPGPEMWKLTTLDRFDGLRFVRSGLDERASIDVQDLPLPLNPRWYVIANFALSALKSAVLPTEQGTAVGVNYSGPLRYDRDGTVRVRSAVVAAGARYTALAYVPAPRPAELRAAPRAFPSVYLRYTEFDLPTPNQSGLRIAATDSASQGVLQTQRPVIAPRPGVPPGVLPATAKRILASPYAGMYRLARRLALRRRSPYDVAVAIQTYLEDNYAYSEQPPRRRYPLEAFLFTDRIGYCQQFSGAMALMLRMDGIPARVAAGFLPGSYDATAHRFVVRAVDAHSWVEVYFAGTGWVAFNPTPPRTTNPVARFPSSEASANRFAAIAATVGSPPRVATPGRAAPRSPRSSSAGVALLALAIVGLLASLAVSARWLRGAVRLRHSLDGDGELATHELVRALRRLGYAMPATVTLAQVESMVRLHGGPDAARYVRLLRERRYAPGSVPSPTLGDRRRMRLALTVHLGLDSRLRGLWALPPATLTRLAPRRAPP